MILSEERLIGMSRSEVLSLPVESKKMYLRALQVRHKKLEILGRNTGDLLSPYNDTNILALIGATGVGKSTFSRLLIKSLIERQQSEGMEDKSSVPLIYVDTPANGDKAFSWSAFYEKILINGQEILIDKKSSRIVDDVNHVVRPGRRKGLSALRDAIRMMISNRGVKVIVVDEAYHLLRFGDFSAVMDTLKSIVDETSVKLVLIGTYDLFDLVTDYAQVARRAEILHFDRYHIDNHEDRIEFGKIIKKFQERWPCDEVPRFDLIERELMEASLGCVGILKSILSKALQFQLKEKNQSWNPNCMAKAGKSRKLLTKIQQDIDSGEAKVMGATYGESFFSGAVLDRVAVKMRG